jgi:hypothetical protein
MPAHATRPTPIDEDVIDPALPICDPHHHLWDRHGNRYLLDELLADTGQADAHGARHNVRGTAFAASAMRPAGMPASRSAIRTATRAGTCCWTPAFAQASRNWHPWG